MPLFTELPRTLIILGNPVSDKRASRKSNFVLCSQTPHNTQNATQDSNDWASANKHSRKLSVAKSRPLPPVAEYMRA
jgi:hypothetical protein